MGKDKVKSNTRSAQCSACRRPTSIYNSQGLTGEGVAFITPMTTPCPHCAETERLRGWGECIKHLIDEREGSY